MQRGLLPHIFDKQYNLYYSFFIVPTSVQIPKKEGHMADGKVLAEVIAQEVDKNIELVFQQFGDNHVKIEGQLSHISRAVWELRGMLINCDGRYKDCSKVRNIFFNECRGMGVKIETANGIFKQLTLDNIREFVVCLITKYAYPKAFKQLYGQLILK